MEIIITDKNFDYRAIYNQVATASPFIEENYVDPRSVAITFPEKKRNLIYIFVESLETTYLSAELGGAQPANLIPEITRMADAHHNFSDNDFLGGGHVVSTGWTAASLVGQTAGVPIMGMAGNANGRSNEFLPNLHTLGQVLQANGYTQEFIMGSDAAFAGRDIYFRTHGNYQLLDYVFAKENGVIPADYHVWWGFEDKRLYAWAKKEALRLYREEAPFNLTLLTVDTHHVGGYVCDLCGSEYSDPYANVIACASRQLYDFISWAESQDFFKDTTIVISGDHPSMDPNFFTQLDGTYERRPLNIFINPAAGPGNTKNRDFSAFDMFPTTLAALGAEIEGNRLGLGANLFSNEPTLIEKYSLQSVITELGKLSKFYIETFW